MKEVKIDDKNQGKNVESPESPARRKALKKAAYVAPALIVLGVLTPIKATAISQPPPPPETGQFDPRNQ